MWVFFIVKQNKSKLHHIVRTSGKNGDSHVGSLWSYLENTHKVSPEPPRRRLWGRGRGGRRGPEQLCSLVSLSSAGPAPRCWSSQPKGGGLRQRRKPGRRTPPLLNPLPLPGARKLLLHVLLGNRCTEGKGLVFITTFLS